MNASLGIRTIARFFSSFRAGLAELADAMDSKSIARKGVPVRLRDPVSPRRNVGFVEVFYFLAAGCAKRRDVQEDGGARAAKFEKIEKNEKKGLARSRFCGMINASSTLKTTKALLPDWRNWQTRWIQNPLPARASRFDSGIRYSFLDETLFRRGFLFLARRGERF